MAIHGNILADLGVGANFNLGAGISNIFSNFVMLFLFLIAGGIVTYWWISKKSYHKTIHVFEDVNGIPAPMNEDKAKEITLPFTSVRAYFLKRRKIYLPRPSIQTGKDHYWYFVRDDGEWVNIGLESLNAKLKELKIKFDHTDMRMANASLKKLVEKNYKKLNWLKEYAPYIGFAIIIMMLGIAGYLVMSEANKVVGSANSNVEVLRDILAEMKDILVIMDDIGSSSGIRSAIT